MREFFVFQPLTLSFSNSSFRSNRQRLRLLLCLVTTCSLSVSHTFSQQTVREDLEDYGLTITAPDRILMAGDTATLVISTQYKASEAIALQVQLKLGPGAVQTVPDSVNANDSWFFSAGPNVFDSSGNLIVEGTCSPAATGSGTLFEVTLEAATDNVPASALLGGGSGHILIVIEDIGFKQSQSLPSTGQPKFFPNPFRDQLHLDPNGLPLEELAIYRADGTLIETSSPGIFQTGTWNLSHLPSGRYLLRWKNAEEEGHRWIIHN